VEGDGYSEIRMAIRGRWSWCSIWRGEE